MKTLKKSLAFVLVVAMVLSMGVIGASAAFTDVKADAEYKQAIEVMTAVGVINGMTSTTFEPDGLLTREQAAKIIAYMLLGPKNAELISTATTQRFNDVSKDRWSAGYIEYCANLGIINGVGDNNFAPEGKLTTVAFTKLLLGALGYDSIIEGFVGDSWAINVAAKAVDAGIAQDGIVLSDLVNITRAQACQLAFLTMKSTLVDYANRGTTITVNGIDIATGASKAEAVYSTAKSNQNIKVGDPDTLGAYTFEFAEKYFPKLEIAKNTDAVDKFGRPADVWSNDGKKVGTYASDALLSYTATVKEKALFSDIGVAGTGSPKAIKLVAFYVDGVDVLTSDLSIRKGDDTNIANTGNGVLFEIYETDTKNEYIAVAVNEYFGEVTKVTKATASGDERYITVGGKSFETEDFAKDDRVIYTVAAGEIQTVKLADYDEDMTVTGYSTGSKTVTFDGTTYKYSQNADNALKTGTYEFTNSYSFYYDSYGNVIFSEIYTADNSNYVYVLAVSSTVQGEAGFDDLYVNVKYVDGEGKVSTVKDYSKNGAGLETIIGGAGSWYTISEDNNHSGFYSFKAVATTPSTAVDKFSSANPNIGGIIANKDTVFVIKTGDSTYKVYEGLNNLPTFQKTSTGSNIVLQAIVKSGYATFVYADVSNDWTSSSTGSKELVYFFNTAPSGMAYDSVNKVTYYEYTVFVSGDSKTSTIKLNANNLVGATGLNTVEGYDANGYINKVESVAGVSGYKIETITNKAVTFKSGTLRIDGEGYTLDTATVYKMDNAKGTYTEVDISDIADDHVTGTFYLVQKSSTNGTIVEIYFTGSVLTQYSKTFDLTGTAAADEFELTATASTVVFTDGSTVPVVYTFNVDGSEAGIDDMFTSGGFDSGSGTALTSGSVVVTYVVVGSDNVAIDFNYTA